MSQTSPTRRVFLEAMIIGNVARDDAVSLAQAARARLVTSFGTRPIFPSQAKDLRALRLPAGPAHVLDEAAPNQENENSAVLVVHQVGVIRQGARCAKHAHEATDPTRLGAVVLFWVWGRFGTDYLWRNAPANLLARIARGTQRSSLLLPLACRSAWTTCGVTRWPTF